MHRYEELEKIYYKKLYLKIFLYGVIFLIFIGIGIVSFNYFPSKKAHSNVIEKKQTIHKPTKKEVKKKYKKVIQKKEVKKISPKNQELEFVLPNLDKTKEKPKIKKISLPQPKKRKNIEHITIQETSVNLKSLIEEYKTNKDYNIAITIAKIYFQQNNLKKAQMWALNANSLNPAKAESWLLFADILIRQNKIKKAKEILNFYINSYGKDDKIENKLRSLNDK